MWSPVLKLKSKGCRTFPVLWALLFWGLTWTATGGEDVQEKAWTSRRYIPSDTLREGEVRLYEEEEERIMDVLLYTRSIGRAFRAIGNREQEGYPKDHPHHEASSHYLRSLKEFRDHLRSIQDKAEGRPEIQARLRFHWEPDLGWILFERITLKEVNGDVQVDHATVDRELILPPDYVKNHIDWMIDELF